MTSALLWIHLLCMVGCFGGLLAIQVAIPADVRGNPEVARGAAKLFNTLLGIGLIFGAVNYFLVNGLNKGAHYNGVIGLKFVILLAVGALLGMSGKKGKGDLFRLVSLTLLAIAALAGTSLYPH